MKIFFRTLITTPFLLITLLAHTQGVDIYYDGKWYICPPEPVAAYNFDLKDCLEVPSLETESSGGAAANSPSDGDNSNTNNDSDSGSGYIFFTAPLPGPNPNNFDPNDTGSSGNTGNNTSSIGTQDPLEIGEGEETPEVEIICKCETCDYCGGCILEYGEELPVGCQQPCTCCDKYFKFGCIHGIHEVAEHKLFESVLWSTASLSFAFFIQFANASDIFNFLSDLISDLSNTITIIKIELFYNKATFSRWGGDIKYHCSEQRIVNISNDQIFYTNIGILDGVGLTKMWAMSTDGSSELIKTSYDQLAGDVIPSSTIDRDGIPVTGEQVYKEFTSYPIIK